MIDTTTNTKITDITVGAGAAFLGAHGDRVYVSNAFDDSVSVIDTTANAVVETVPVGSIPQRLAVSPDGHHVYVINGVDGTISVITSVAPAPANHPPVANAGTLQNATENGVTTASLANLVTDADGDALTLEVVTQPALGTVTFLTATTFRYVAPAEIGTATSTTFTYRALDGAAYSDPAIVTINFVNSNDAPVAVDDSYAAEKDATLTIAAPGVLANDSDVDRTALTVVPMTGAAHGTLNLHPDGSFTYTPATGFVGTDSFTYAVSDGALQSNIATATITVSAVNDAPVTTNTTLTMDEYASIAINLANSSSDPDGDALTGILIDGASHGVLNFFPNRTFNYNPDSGFVGTDTVPYTVSDGALQSNIATVTIIVTAHNDAPTATDDTASVDEDTTVTISALSNDSDPDGEALSVTAVGTPGHGSASLGTGGVIAYTPAENYFGDDSFTYTVGDGALTATATGHRDREPRRGSAGDQRGNRGCGDQCRRRREQRPRTTRPAGATPGRQLRHDRHRHAHRGAALRRIGHRHRRTERERRGSTSPTFRTVCPTAMLRWEQAGTPRCCVPTARWSRSAAAATGRPPFPSCPTG